MSLTFLPAIPVECYAEAINEVESHSVENPLYDATLNGLEPEEGEPDKDAYKWTRSRRMTPRAIHGALVMSERAQVFCHHHPSWEVKRVYTSPFPEWPVSYYRSLASSSSQWPTDRTEGNQYEFVATNMYRHGAIGPILPDYWVTTEEKAGTLPGYPNPYVAETVPNSFAYYSLIPVPGTSYPGGRAPTGGYPDFPTTLAEGRDNQLGDFQWMGFIEWRNATQSKTMARYPELGTQHTLQAEITIDGSAIARAVPYCLQAGGEEPAITDAGVVARSAFDKFGGGTQEIAWQAEGESYADRVLGDGDGRLRNDLLQRGAFSIPLGHAPNPMFDLNSNRSLNLVASALGILAPGDQFMTGVGGGGVGCKIDIPLVEVFLGTARANIAPTPPGAVTLDIAHVVWPGIVRNATVFPSHWFMPIGFSVEQALRLLPDVVTCAVRTSGWINSEGGGAFDYVTYVSFALHRDFPTEPQYAIDARSDAAVLAAPELTPPEGYEEAIAFVGDWLNGQIVACTVVGLVEVLDEIPEGGADSDRERLAQQPLYGLPALGTFGVQFRA